MIVLLGTAGTFLYLKLASDLSQALDQELRQRAEDLAVLVRDPGAPLDATASAPLIESGESFAQVVDGRGRVLDSTGSLGSDPLVTRADVAQVGRGPVFADRPAVPGLDEPARLLEIPVLRRGQPVVLIVGATLENRAETLARLRNELLIGVPLTVAAASLGGYVLAGAALRPVEALRRRAAAISAHSPGQRLPELRGRDELAALSTTLNGMLSRLETALDRERRFVADASHELRTPLASLKTELELALRHPRSAAELRAAIESAAEETDRLTRLAEDLLLIAQSEQERLPVSPVPVDVRQALERSAASQQRRARAQGRRITSQSDPGLTVLADPGRLEQALRNLVDNALGHGAGTVRMEGTGGVDTVEIHVKDAGSGFPDDYLSHVFERFSRPQASRSGGGTGLGLSIVEAIARAHGGSAHAANGREGGTDIWIVLPALRRSHARAGPGG
jgi:signal transduction histidine kinase